MNDSTIIAVITLTIAISAFILFWFFLLHLFGCLSGWKRMAKIYRARSRPARTYWASAQVGFIRYNGVMFIGCDERGLWLSVIWPFKVSSPDLTIPLEKLQPVKGSFLDFHFDRIKLSVQMSENEKPCSISAGKFTIRRILKSTQSTYVLETLQRWLESAK